MVGLRLHIRLHIASAIVANLTTEARSILDGSLAAAQPDAVLRAIDMESIAARDLSTYRHVWVVGMGKAALAMASVLEELLRDSIDGGFVVTARGYADTLPNRYERPTRIEFGEGGHPLPDSGSREAARRVLRIAQRAGTDDLVIVLISGGGSSVCADFAAGISLADAQTTFQLLLNAGVDIYAINTVRKHLSTIGGGRLAAAIYPAEVSALIISDVVGDDVSVISSGPTAGDPTTFEDAADLLHRTNLWDEIPESVRDYMRRCLQSGEGESPKPDDPIFGNVRNRVVATNETALRGASDAAHRLGYDVRIIDSAVIGEARDAGRRLVEKVMNGHGRTRTCFLAGGETSVTVRGKGKGGRNQEMVLSAAIALEESEANMVFLSAGTDGIDGPTDAAGAIVTSATAKHARSRGIDPAEFLRRNDSYSFFEKIGGLVRTGPTHTNVMDVQIILL